MKISQLIAQLERMRARIGRDENVVLKVNGLNVRLEAVAWDAHDCEGPDACAEDCLFPESECCVDVVALSDDPDEGRDFAWESEARLRAMEAGGW